MPQIISAVTTKTRLTRKKYHFKGKQSDPHQKTYTMSAWSACKIRMRKSPNAKGLPEDVIVSPDALRDQRIPPGQSRTRKWPVLDASGPPVIDLTHWRFRIAGLVGTAKEWCMQEFLELPRRKFFADFHCVTRW